MTFDILTSQNPDFLLSRVKEQAERVYLLWGTNGTTAAGDSAFRENVHISEFLSHGMDGDGTTCLADVERSVNSCRKYLYHFGPLSDMPTNVIEYFPQHRWLEVGANTYEEKMGNAQGVV